MMELQYEEMEYGIRLIKLIGALDNTGVRSVESKFVLHCAGKQVKVVVDLSEMEFLAPGGSGLLLWAAKEVKRRGEVSCWSTRQQLSNGNSYKAGFRNGHQSVRTSKLLPLYWFPRNPLKTQASCLSSG